MTTDRFRPGDRVVHATASMIPEGALGTVLGPVTPEYRARGYAWEVEYDDYPCPFQGSMTKITRSPTSWYSRDASIELTREAAIARAREMT